MKDVIFLDNAATTQLYPEVLDNMTPWLCTPCQNASAAYSCSKKAAAAIDNAREIIAETIHAYPDEIFFTSGGSESDNWAIKGIADAHRNKGNHIITTCIEHSAILDSCRYLNKFGYETTFLGVDSSGMINVSDIKESISEGTILISVMMANNEIGTIEPISEIGRLSREKQVLFHSDAVQAYGHLPINVKEQNLDMLSASGHKFGGPQGIGFLYIKRGTFISNLIHGGGQQKGKRAGTENVASIVGIAKAAEISYERLSKVSKKESKLQQYIVNRIKTEIPDVIFNGSFKNRLHNNINCTIKDVPGNDLVRLLGKHGICLSTASACTVGEQKISHVLKAIRLSDEAAECTIRVSLGRDTTEEEVTIFIDYLKEYVHKIRTIRGCV